jgi:apolipoprotein N-acyltransferase
VVKHVQKSAWWWAITSGVLQVLVFPKPNFYFLGWVALAPLIYALLRSREATSSRKLAEQDTFSYLVPASTGQGFLLGWASGTIFFLGTCYWLYDVMKLHGGLSVTVSLLLLLLLALAAGLAEGLFGALVARAAEAEEGFSRKALVLAPFLWVTIELLRSHVWNFPWNLLGYAQVDNIPLARLAAVTGVYGISFEIAVVNVAFATAFLVRPRRRRKLLLAAAICAAMLQSSQFIPFPSSPHSATALLVQQNLPLDGEWTPEEYEQTLTAFEGLSTKQTQGANLVVWPESPAPFFLNDERFTQTLGRIAQSDKAWVVAGSLGIPTGENPAQEIYNSAVLVGPDGRVASRYDKLHLVPWGEYVPLKRLMPFIDSLTHESGNFRPGNERGLLNAGELPLGTFICYEAVFPGEVRRFAERGGQLFINISDDGWFGSSAAPLQHLRMARMRAIENERWLLRDTDTGITASIDPLGRVVMQAERDRRLAIAVPYGAISEQTFYTQFGDWFPILCAIISLVVLLWRHRTVPEMPDAQPVG